MIAVGGLTRFSDPISWAVVPFALCLDREAVREAEDFAVTHNARGVATTLVAYEQGTVRQQVIEAKQAIGNQWLVSAGFSAGDRVVVQGTQRAMTCSPRYAGGITLQESEQGSGPTIAAVQARGGSVAKFEADREQGRRRP